MGIHMNYSRKTIYADFLSLVYRAHVGHIGSCLSVMDILIVLYFHIKRKEDIVLLSKGHAAPALYTVLAAAGLLSRKKLSSFHSDGTKLPVHVPQDLIKGIPFASGSLGHGLSLCSGMAHGKKLQKKGGTVYCILSDGECNEGQVWEAAQYAAHHNLNNLIALVDVNGVQAFGNTKDVLGEVSAEKWRAFGWNTYECNGHSIREITNTIKKIKKTSKPSIILCHTIKGYGLSFFENKIESHYLPLSEKQYEQGLQEIKIL
jgi:transketolase